jgi:hypothetical protein
VEGPQSRNQKEGLSKNSNLYLLAPSQYVKEDQKKRHDQKKVDHRAGYMKAKADQPQDDQN